eukprot:2820846-Lingulodinium_polyedra.AAC.1
MPASVCKAYCSVALATAVVCAMRLCRAPCPAMVRTARRLLRSTQKAWQGLLRVPWGAGRQREAHS